MALPISPPEPSEIANFDEKGILDVVEHDMQLLVQRNEALIKYRQYFEGEQENNFATEELKKALGSDFESFKFNWCEVVVGALEERINLNSISSPVNQPLAEELWQTILYNNKAYLEERTYNGALVEARSALFVWPEVGENGTIIGVKLDPVEATKLYVTYENGDPRRLIRALKIWYTTTDRIMATLYTRDAIYKFEGDENLFTDYRTRDQNLLTGGRTLQFPTTHTRIWRRRQVEGEQWPLPNPYNEIPLVEFTNRFNRSEVKLVIPAQDALNKTIVNMFTTAEYDAHRQKYMVTSNEEPEGGWKNTPGHVWIVEPETNFDGNPLPVQIGQFETSDMTAYVKIIEQMIIQLAAISRTPGSYFMVNVNAGGRGDAPSGDALRVSETGLVKKIETLHERWVPSWRNVFRLIYRTLNGFQQADPDLINSINFHWQHPMAHYRFMLLEEARKMMQELNIPAPIAWRYAGLTPEEISMAEELSASQEAEQPNEEIQPNEPTAET